MLLHSGPPLTWETASGPMRGALIGACLFEGWATDVEDAERILAAGEITLDPCHHHRTVGPMAGVTSPSMWMWCLKDPVNGGEAFCNLNEGLGKVLRMGAYNDEVLTRLAWMRDVLGPILSTAVRGSVERNDPLDVKAILAQMLQMGDEGHNRNRAGSLMTLRELSPAIVAVDAPSSDIAAVLKFIGGNEHFYLNLGMPTAKLAMDAARDVPGSSLVTVLSRNGTEFGIQTAGTGDRWFTGPAQTPVGLFLGDYGPEDANPDIGDSAIMEAYGVGGFSMAAAPGHRAVRRRHGARRAGDDRADVPAHARGEPGDGHPDHGLPRVADRHRRPQGGAHRLAAADQHRHGRAGGRHRSGRRRARAAAAGVLREGARGTRREAPRLTAGLTPRRSEPMARRQRRMIGPSHCASPDKTARRAGGRIDAESVPEGRRGRGGAACARRRWELDGRLAELVPASTLTPLQRTVLDHDWASTPLGAEDAWSPTLRSRRSAPA